MQDSKKQLNYDSVVDDWQQNAKSHDEENYEFLRSMKFRNYGFDPDELAGQLHKQAFQIVDCTRCANCCKTMEITECRNGFCDTSGYGGGKQESWFASFPAVLPDRSKKALADGRMAKAYGYWFLLKNTEPMLCFDIDGQLYTPNGQVHDLASIYAKHSCVWTVIADTALELLP